MCKKHAFDLIAIQVQYSNVGVFTHSVMSREQLGGEIESQVGGNDTVARYKESARRNSRHGISTGTQLFG